MKRHHIAALVALILVASALFAQPFVTRRWDDAAIPDAVSFAAGNKVMGLNGSVVTRFSRSVFDALYALKSRSIATTAPLSGGGDLSADRTLTVASATTSAVGVVELAEDGEDAANVVVQGNDSRMDNARAPTTHASNHFVGGSDPLDVFYPYGQYDPHNPPASIFASDSWDTGADTLTWRDTNFGASTKTYTMDSLVVDSDSSGATQMRLRYTDLPAAGTDWTVTLVLSSTLGSASDSAGLAVLCGGTEGTPSCVEAFVMDATGSETARLIHFNDSDYNTATGTSSRGSFGSPIHQIQATHTHCMQFRYLGASSNVLTSHFSFNCKSFKQVGSTTLGGDPASIATLAIDDVVAVYQEFRIRAGSDLVGE